MEDQRVDVLRGSTGLASWSDGVAARDTIREISQQPRLWRTVGRAISDRSLELRSFVERSTRRPHIRVMLSGAGTSGYIGEILAPIAQRHMGVRVEAVATTDIVASPSQCFAVDIPTLLVSMARSGDSPESLASIALAEEHLSEEVFHLIVTCNAEGALARRGGKMGNCKLILMPTEANDRGFAMTSSATTMLLATGLVLGVFRNEDTDPIANAAEKVLREGLSNVETLVDELDGPFVFLGSGALTGLAREAALKLVELTAGRVHAIPESCLGFRHGPKAALTSRTCAVVFISNDALTRRYDLDMVAELACVPGLRVIVVCSEGSSLELPTTVELWKLPGVALLNDAAVAVVALTIAQLIALRTSLKLGLDPDNPFPSGEVNRVVRGVKIYPSKEIDRGSSIRLSDV